MKTKEYVYPQPEQYDFYGSSTVEMEGGLQLRDYFAARALNGVIAHPQGNAGDWETAAKNAYLAADAMMEARKL